MKRICVVLALLAAAVVWLGSSRAGDSGFKNLFNGKNFEGWKFELGKADPEKTFKVKDGIIVVSGNPNGYFYTDKSYKNYILRFDWRYKRPKGLEDDEKFGGNSGLLVAINMAGSSPSAAPMGNSASMPRRSRMPASRSANGTLPRSPSRTAPLSAR